MRDIELEEGEAYFPQEDDDEKNIDPDKDLSYIDKKIENCLGHFQKDFMGGVSTENLGARYGGYGSFLPMYQRSPPIVPNKRTQIHISSKSPQNLLSEHFQQNPTAGANHSLPVKAAPGLNDNRVQALSESGISSVKAQGPAECALTNQQTKPMINHLEQKSYKLRVKFQNVLSGLGLDISPSSLEDSPSEDDETSPGMQVSKPESPSYIIKIMTTLPLPNNELLSPLHDSLLCLMGTENNVATALSACPQALPVHSIHGSTCSEGKREASKDRKSKAKDRSKNRKSKQKEPGEERKSKEKVQSVKPLKLVENQEYLANAVAISANKKEESETSAAEVNIISKAAMSEGDAQSGDMRLVALKGNSTGSQPSLFDMKSEVGCSEEDIGISMQQVLTADDKVKTESASASSHNAAAGDERDVNTLREEAEEGENAISILRRESSADNKNEVAHVEAGAKKSWKKQSMSKDKVKGRVLESTCPKQDGGCRKGSEMVEKISKDEDIDFVQMKGVDENDKQDDIYEEMKDNKYKNNVETLEPSRQKTNSKEMPPSQMAAGVLSGKEHPSSVAKKKARASQTDGIRRAEQPRRSLVAGSPATEKEGVVKHNLPSKSNRSDVALQRERRKGSDVASDVYPGKKGKEVSSKDIVMGVSERETHAFMSKLKEGRNSNNGGVASNLGSSMEGDLAGVNCVIDHGPVNWVQCEECQKWRILPPGMDPESLPKEWLCSMQTWLPGRNKCSVSEDETSEVMHALYPTPVPPLQVQNNQLAYPDGCAIAGASGGAQHADLPGQGSTVDALAIGGKRRNLAKTDTDAARRSGFQEHIPVKKNQQQHSSDISNSRNQRKLLQESNAVRKSGDGKSLSMERKRLADFERSGTPKKIKRVHQQSRENLDLVGLSKIEADSKQNDYPGASGFTKDFVKESLESPLMRTKDRNQIATIAKDSEIKDVREKKRKLKDQKVNYISGEERSGKVQRSLKNCVNGKNNGTEYREENKEKKSKASKFQGRECSTDKGKSRSQNCGNHDIGSADDNSRRVKGGRSVNMSLEERHVDRVSQKSSHTESSDKAIVLGLSDIATTSSSSKVSYKVKAKACEVKSSPVESNSSSAKRISKSDPDKGTDKMSILHNVPEELSKAKQLKFRAEGAHNEFTPHSEEMKDSKSKMSRNSGAMSDAEFEDQSTRTPVGRRPIAHRTDTRTKDQNFKDACGKVDPLFHEGVALTSQQNSVTNQVAKPSNRLHFDETNSERGKSHNPHIGREKEPTCHSEGVPKIEKGKAVTAVNVDNVNMKLSRHPEVENVSLRLPRPAGHIVEKIDASSSMKKDSFQRAADTALTEAKNLKHSANRLKLSGSGAESTEVFFQAALKFLQGASLLEPGNMESGRCEEPKSTDLYSATAKLCEYCAVEYERHSDMASAALAYKCMEVAYMRVVYINDVIASRDRVELQSAVRAVPQVESPSSSASDIDNLNNQAASDTVKDGHSTIDHRIHVISAGSRPNFVRLLNFVEDINFAMEASRKSQSAFSAANPILVQAGNEEGISFIKRVLDCSFHDVDGLLHLVRLAMEALNT